MKKPAKLNAYQVFSQNKTFLVVVFFAALIALFYGNTLANGFVLDDASQIEQNSYIQSLRYIPKAVTGCIWESALGGCEGRTIYYRPIQYVSYILTYQISSHPWAFHFMSMLHFLILVSLTFVFVKYLFKDSVIAFFTALIVLMHPINSEVVNWPSAIAELQMVIFILLSFLFYLLYRERKLKRYIVWTGIFYFLAMLSKEPAVFIVPLAIVALDLLFLEKRFGVFLRRETIKRYFYLAPAVLVYFVMRISVLGGVLGQYEDGEEFVRSFGERLVLSVAGFAEYLRVLVFPYPLQLFYDFPSGSNMLTFSFIASLALILVFCLLFYWFKRSNMRFALFACIWLLLFYIPIFMLSQIAARNFFTERYLLAPTIGFAILIGLVLAYIWRESSRGVEKSSFFLGGKFPILNSVRTRRIVLVLSLILGAFISWQVIFLQNQSWKNTETVLRATLEKNPEFHYIREYLADELRDQGKQKEAEREYKEIVRRSPQYSGISHVYNNLGDLSRQDEDLEKAEDYYKKAVETSAGENYKAYNNLGAFYVDKGQTLKALTNFCRALQIEPEAPEPENNYNRVVSSIYGVDDSQFIFLYSDVISGGAFQTSAEENIAFKRKLCAYGSCLYTFIPQAKQGEILFPFLIMVTAFPQEVIRVSNAEFNGGANEIILTLPDQYQNRLLTFSFPSCSGFRYEVQVSP